MQSKNGTFKAIEYPTDKSLYLKTGEAFYWQLKLESNGRYVGEWHPKSLKFFPDQCMPSLLLTHLQELNDFVEQLN